MSKAAIGADPEFFLTASNGIDIIPSCDLIGGTKDEPLVYNKIRNYKWLEDNVAVELNYPPCNDAHQFAAHTGDALSIARNKLNKMGYNLLVKSSHTFKPGQLTHPKALQIGCSPDFCAYDSNKKRVVDIQSLGNTRYCGGHIHLSYDKKERIPAFAMAMLMDAIVGLPSIVFDKQEDRRKYYGLAGLYREKPYGIEYRTMSNWWLNSTSMLPYMATSILSLGYAVEKRPVELSNLFAVIPFKDVQSSINTEDTKMAYEVGRYIRKHRFFTEAGLRGHFFDYSF